MPSFLTITTRSIFRASSKTLLTEITVHLLDFESIYQTVVLRLKDFAEDARCLCLVIRGFLKLFYLVIKTRQRREAKRYVDMVFTSVYLRKNLYCLLITDCSRSSLSILLVDSCDISKADQYIRVGLSERHQH